MATHVRIAAPGGGDTCVELQRLVLACHRITIYTVPIQLVYLTAAEAAGAETCCACLGRGFARVRCKSCGHERLLAFSCKGRLCPSCQARRMHDVALHLGKQVIPAVPLRQWVMTVPRPLRFRLARDRALRRAVINVVMRSIFMLQRRQARAEGFAEVMPGAVTFLHAAGSAHLPSRRRRATRMGIRCPASRMLPGLVPCRRACSAGATRRRAWRPLAPALRRCGAIPGGSAPG